MRSMVDLVSMASIKKQEILVTIQVSLLLRRLRRREEGEGRGHPAPRPGDWRPLAPLLKSYK